MARAAAKASENPVPARGRAAGAAGRATAGSRGRPARRSEPEVRWLTPEQLDDWLDLAATMIMLPWALESQLTRDAGFSQFEYFVLAHLSESPNQESRMSDLAFMTKGSLSRLSHVVSRLEQRGLVSRRPSPEDGRTTIAALTPAGLATLKEAAPGHVARVRDLVVDALTPEQFAALGEACRVILQRIEQVEGTPVLQPPKRAERGAGRA